MRSAALPFAKPFVLALFAFLFVACEKESSSSDTGGVSEIPDVLIYGLTDDNKLQKLSSKNPQTPLQSTTITGLLSGEKALSIDFRPSTGQLYLLSSTSVLYLLDPQTAKASIVSASQFMPKLSPGYASIDFNPTVDRIRLVSSSGTNLRLHPETGNTVAEDGAIKGVPGAMINAIAYTNSKAGATETVLYDIDVTTDKLYKQLPPNAGTLIEVGALEVDISGAGAFDISSIDNMALAALNVSGTDALYGIDLMTGKATVYGALSQKLIGLAIPTTPVAYGIDDANNLLVFDPANTASVVSKPITGLQAGENIIGIDFRPINGQLYGLGNNGGLYTFNLASGAAAMVGSGIALKGSEIGFDFNPVVDRIRIVTDSAENLRVHPVTGAVAFTDAMLNPGMPSITAAAYTNNMPGATSTSLFVLDSESDQLFRQDPPNAGTLTMIGSLGLDVSSANAFDISGTSGTAYAVSSNGTTTSLYSINLTTGSAVKLSDFSQPINAFAVGW
jgi:hypothetical protein